MPKIFLNQSTIKDGWERNPDASGDADFKTLVRKNQGFFMSKIFLNQSTIKDGWERNPDASGDADFKTLVRKNQGKFMPKIFLNQSTIKDGWERNPDASGDADFKTLVRKNQGKFMPKIFLIETAPLELHSCGNSMHFLLEFTPISSSHSSPIRFYPAPCIGIRDSRDVNFDPFFLFLVNFIEEFRYSFS
jgi:hypothetical protein